MNTGLQPTRDMTCLITTSAPIQPCSPIPHSVPSPVGQGRHQRIFFVWGRRLAPSFVFCSTGASCGYERRYPSVSKSRLNSNRRGNDLAKLYYFKPIYLPTHDKNCTELNKRLFVTKITEGWSNIPSPGQQRLTRPRANVSSGSGMQINVQNSSLFRLFSVISV